MARSDPVDDALRWLKRRGTKRERDAQARFGIAASKSFGVSVGTIQQLGKRLGRDHDLALALWETGWYEARLLTAFVDDPALVTAAQMDRWTADFDNWGVCDTLCFHLFDRTPHAWRKVDQWTKRRDEFVRRAGFALMACLALHDKEAADARFVRSLKQIERGATDDRNFVKKGVSWALRLIGRRNPALNVAALDVARRLADSTDATARWMGKDAVRELTGPVVKRQLAARKTAK
jgi:3-methyladenine DNA glycosylase AlkD